MLDIHALIDLIGKIGLSGTVILLLAWAGTRFLDRMSSAAEHRFKTQDNVDEKTLSLADRLLDQNRIDQERLAKWQDVYVADQKVTQEIQRMLIEELKKLSDSTGRTITYLQALTTRNGDWDERLGLFLKAHTEHLHSNTLILLNIQQRLNTSPSPNIDTTEDPTT